MGIDTGKLGQQSVGDYDLVEKIAEGGMGAIFKGRDRRNGQIVAIKIMAAHIASNGVLLKRFEQEFRAASRLDHPNIVRALDYGDTGGAPYLVMEFVDGESLGQKIDPDGHRPENEAIRLIAQVAQGLHRAHKQNLVHRDVKPDNILVTQAGAAKLADLGLVKETETDLNLTRTGRSLGTPHFMAPEQFRNAKNADARCDIYALAATLYMMVTGELPFQSAGPLDAWMKKVKNELTALPHWLVPSVIQCRSRCSTPSCGAMSADPTQRPATCREFVEDLTGHSTRRPQVQESALPPSEIWYLVYKDETGTAHTVKGNASAIRRSLRDGLLGDASNIRAARVKAGPFEPLTSYPEFRDLVSTPAPVAVPSKPPSARQPPANVNPNQSAEQPAMQAPHIALGSEDPGQGQGMGGWMTMLFMLLVLAGVGAAAAVWWLPLRAMLMR